MSAFKSDPEWQATYAAFMDEGDETPTDRMLRRIRLAGRLCELETASP